MRFDEKMDLGRQSVESRHVSQVAVWFGVLTSVNWTGTSGDTMCSDALLSKRNPINRKMNSKQ